MNIVRLIKELSVSTKKFTQKGIKDLLEIPKHKDCKARGLTIYFYKR
jgi:hypothetical protein